MLCRRFEPTETSGVKSRAGGEESIAVAGGSKEKGEGGVETSEGSFAVASAYKRDLAARVTLMGERVEEALAENVDGVWGVGGAIVDCGDRWFACTEAYTERRRGLTTSFDLAGAALGV